MLGVEPWNRVAPVEAGAKPPREPLPTPPTPELVPIPLAPMPEEYWANPLVTGTIKRLASSSA